MHSIAKHYGGKCLSGAYKDEHSMLEWMCEKGHRWESAYKVVNQGGWCMQCLKKQQHNQERFEAIKQIAVNKGGKCLSTEYKNYSTKLEFQCGEMHKWKAFYFTIKNGHWCGKCGNNNRIVTKKPSIELFQNIALLKGGKCLSDKYINSSTKLELECIDGHRWMTKPSAIIRGTWCAKCHDKQRGNIRRKHTIEMFQKIAKDRGGKCLTEIYIHITGKLEFECANGHKWKAAAYDIKRGGWCRICVHKEKSLRQKDFIETFYKIAEERGGACLSTEYIGSQEKLEFQCADNHRWKATGNSIKVGSWCMICYNKSKRKIKN